MDDRNIRRFERATRVQTFGRDNAADFAPGGKAAALFLELDPIVLELTEARVGQLRTPVGKPVLIDALSTDFKDIARTARAIKLDDPTFPDGDFRHPAKKKRNPAFTLTNSTPRIRRKSAPPECGMCVPTLRGGRIFLIYRRSSLDSKKRRQGYPCRRLIRIT